MARCIPFLPEPGPGSVLVVYIGTDGRDGSTPMVAPIPGTYTRTAAVLADVLPALRSGRIDWAEVVESRPVAPGITAETSRALLTFTRAGTVAATVRQ